MAMIIICDACGAEILDAMDVSKIRINASHSSRPHTVKEYDICEDCLKDIQDFVEEKDGWKRN